MKARYSVYVSVAKLGCNAEAMWFNVLAKDEDEARIITMSYLKSNKLYGVIHNINKASAEG